MGGGQNFQTLVNGAALDISMLHIDGYIIGIPPDLSCGKSPLLVTRTIRFFNAE